MTNTIYVLTEGSYSDYHIIGVYSTKELAEKAEFLYPDSQIEEYSLDNVPDHPPNMRVWCVNIKNGKLYRTGQTNPDTGVPSEHSWNDFNGGNTYIVYCWATDEEHAQKIALDKYHQYQAQQAGIA